MKLQYTKSYTCVERTIKDVRLFSDMSISDIIALYLDLQQYLDMMPLELDESIPLGVRLTKNVNIVIGNKEKNKEEDKILEEIFYNHNTRVIETGIAIHRLMTDEEKKLINIDNFVCSAILHDIGKLFSIDNHAIYSYIMADYILTKMNFDEQNKYNIIHSILVHSYKTRDDVGLFISDQDKLLMDADLMDDIKCKYKIIKVKKKEVSLEVGDKKKIMFADVSKYIGDIQQDLIDKKSSKIQTNAGKLFFESVMDEYRTMIKLYAPTSSNTTDLSMGLLK